MTYQAPGPLNPSMHSIEAIGGYDVPGKADENGTYGSKSRTLGRPSPLTQHYATHGGASHSSRYNDNNS